MANTAKSFRAAMIQFTAAREPAPNVETLAGMIGAAHDGGADLILLPENANWLEPDSKRARAQAVDEAADPLLAQCRTLARDRGVWILLGSIAVLAGDKRANRSLLVDDRGEIAARYDKIHMFDVDIGDGQVYRESAVIEPGDRAVIAETPWGKVGLTVCYDLRFPHLYRALAQGGANILTVPAAFTRKTGEAHWHTLLRARAIENGAFVLAPCQCGTHAEGRETFGHSLAVDPWGKVIADGGPGPGVVYADIDMARVGAVRAMIPSLDHDRPFEKP